MDPLQSSSHAVTEENGQSIESDNSNNNVPVRKSYNTLGLGILCICIASFVIQTVIKILYF
jgi:hypothetical protein